MSMKKHLRHVLLWIYDKNNQIKGDDAVEEIREVYGHDSIGRMTVFRWLKKFRNGDKNVDDLEDDPRSGRPSKFNEKSFFLTTTGDLGYGLLILTRVSDKQYDVIFWLFRFEASFATQLWRAAFLCVILERTCATIFYKTYENEGPIWLALVLMTLTTLFASLVISTYYVFRLHVFVTCGLIALIDLTCIFITENLRVLQIMIPMIIVGTVFDISALIAGFIQVTISYNTIMEWPLYFLITNMYVTVAFYIYFKKDKRTQRRVRALLCRSPAVEPEESVINIDGKPLVMSQSMSLHFMQLESYWKFRKLGVIS